MNQDWYVYKVIVSRSVEWAIQNKCESVLGEINDLRNRMRLFAYPRAFTLNPFRPWFL